MTLGQARRRGLCGAADTPFALAVAGHEGDPCAQDPDTGALIHNIDPRQGWVIAACAKAAWLCDPLVCLGIEVPFRSHPARNGGHDPGETSSSCWSSPRAPQRLCWVLFLPTVPVPKPVSVRLLLMVRAFWGHHLAGSRVAFGEAVSTPCSCACAFVFRWMSDLLRLSGDGAGP